MIPITLVYLLLALLLALHLHPLSFLHLVKQQKQRRQTVLQGRHAQSSGTKSAFWHNSSLPSQLPSYASSMPWNAASFSNWKTRESYVETAFRISTFGTSQAFMGARFLNASRLIIVDQFGYGHFCTIQEAVNSIPVNNTFSYTILVAGGLFEEKVIVPHNKPFITIQGLGTENTIISWHDTAATFAVTNPDIKRPRRPLGTFHSATVAVNAPNFIARGMTFQNTAPMPADGMAGGQAVALQVSGDKVAFYNCSFRGRQDTLYDHKGRHYFRNCYVEGSIDFIFGDGLSLYKACQIHAVGSGFITAQKRQNASENTGFSFVECQITGSNASLELYLGRAWGPFSRVVFASCYMDAIVVPQGWHNWGDANRELTVSYSEFNSSGPGARASQRVIWSRQLDSSEVSPLISISFVQGDQWLLYA